MIGFLRRQGYELSKKTIGVDVSRHHNDRTFRSIDTYSTTIDGVDIELEVAFAQVLKRKILDL